MSMFWWAVGTFAVCSICYLLRYRDPGYPALISVGDDGVAYEVSTVPLDVIVNGESADFIGPVGLNAALTRDGEWRSQLTVKVRTGSWLSDGTRTADVTIVDASGVTEAECAVGSILFEDGSDTAVLSGYVKGTGE